MVEGLSGGVSDHLLATSLIPSALPHGVHEGSEDLEAVVGRELIHVRIFEADVREKLLPAAPRSSALVVGALFDSRGPGRIRPSKESHNTSSSGRGEMRKEAGIWSEQKWKKM